MPTKMSCWALNSVLWIQDCWRQKQICSPGTFLRGYMKPQLASASRSWGRASRVYASVQLLALPCSGLHVQRLLHQVCLELPAIHLVFVWCRCNAAFDVLSILCISPKLEKMKMQAKLWAQVCLKKKKSPLSDSIMWSKWHTVEIRNRSRKLQLHIFLCRRIWKQTILIFVS